MSTPPGKILAIGPIVAANGTTAAWRPVLVESSAAEVALYPYVVYAEYNPETERSYYTHGVYCESLVEGVITFQKQLAVCAQEILNRRPKQPCSPPGGRVCSGVLGVRVCVRD